MHFEFYHAGLENVPKLSVDGTVGNSIHFSHWEANETPTELKADTSTEIALNLAASPNRDKHTQGIELVTNNHFDTDGVLSVWTVLNGERALQFRDKLIPAAEAGDFSEFTNEAAIRASITIQGSDQPTSGDEAGSPLAHSLAGLQVDDARAYELVLPQVEDVLNNTNKYEPLWRSAWERIAVAVESFERGDSKVQEYKDSKISLVTLSPEVFSRSGFNPTRHSAPYTAISRYARGELFVIATPLQNGWSYRIDYPYYSWAETVVRPRIKRRDFTLALVELNAREIDPHGMWRLDNSEMTSAVKFLGAEGAFAASRLKPDEVANALIAAFTGAAAIAVG